MHNTVQATSSTLRGDWWWGSDQGSRGWKSCVFYILGIRSNLLQLANLTLCYSIEAINHRRCLSSCARFCTRASPWDAERETTIIATVLQSIWTITHTTRGVTINYGMSKYWIRRVEQVSVSLFASPFYQSDTFLPKLTLQYQERSLIVSLQTCLPETWGVLPLQYSLTSPGVRGHGQDRGSSYSGNETRCKRFLLDIYLRYCNSEWFYLPNGTENRIRWEWQYLNDLLSKAHYIRPDKPPFHLPGYHFGVKSDG